MSPENSVSPAREVETPEGGDPIPRHREMASRTEQGNRMKQFAVKALAGALIVSTPILAVAESDTATGTGGLSASASLDFKIVVPKVLYLRVGNVGATNINEINFALTPAQVASPGTAVTTNTGGNATNGVSVEVMGNIGVVTLAANAPTSGLQGGTGNTTIIPYSQIVPSSSDVNLPHPPFGAGAPGLSVPLVHTNGVVKQSATWTFAYSNSNVLRADTYGGSAQGGRVVYAASAP